jgi:hypothetical protein
MGIAWVLAGAFMAGLGAHLRLQAEGTGGRPGTYLLDAGAWLLALTGAILEARAADVLAAFEDRSVRRRATALLGVGLATAIMGCIVASGVGSDSTSGWVRAGASAALIVGFGLGLGGLLSLLWVAGGTYAGERIERLSEEDW